MVWIILSLPLVSGTNLGGVPIMVSGSLLNKPSNPGRSYNLHKPCHIPRRTKAPHHGSCNAWHIVSSDDPAYSASLATRSPRGVEYSTLAHRAGLGHSAYSGVTFGVTLPRCPEKAHKNRHLQANVTDDASFTLIDKGGVGSPGSPPPPPVSGIGL